jgi:hypothetical protein
MGSHLNYALFVIRKDLRWEIIGVGRVIQTLHEEAEAVVISQKQK